MHPFVRRAHLGLSRCPDPETTGSPADMLARQASLSPGAAAEGEAWRVLLAAGGWALWRQAGVRPGAAEPTPDAPDLSGERLCSPQAASLLAELLGGHFRELLPEAVWRLQRAGQVLSPELLPLALATADPAQRALLQPVLGPRGRWLAAHNPAWSWATGQDQSPDPEQAWLEAELGVRVEALRALRRQSPAKALDHLLASWSGERAEDRARLITALEPGLSMADEPFLETCLDDRARGVREAAARLLVTLPSSRLALRMRARAEDILHFHAAGKGRLERLLSGPTRVTLHPPESFTRSYARDGMSEPGEHGLGAPAWWMVQILAAVPPSRWETRFAVAPDLLLALIGPEDWAAVEGLSRAALRCEEPAWLLPLWRWWRQHEGSGRVHKGRCQTWQDDLVRRFPPDQAELLCMELLRSPTLADASRLALALERLPRPWSLPLGRAWLLGLQGSLHALSQGAQHELLWWELSAAQAGAALPESLLTQLPSPDTLVVRRWRNLLSQIRDQAGRRLRLAQEIRP